MMDALCCNLPPLVFRAESFLSPNTEEVFLLMVSQSVPSGIACREAGCIDINIGLRTHPKEDFVLRIMTETPLLLPFIKSNSNQDLSKEALWRYRMQPPVRLILSAEVLMLKQTSLIIQVGKLEWFVFRESFSLKTASHT